MITKAIRRAYDDMLVKNWDTVYWAIDLHGVCFKPNYKNGEYEFINDAVPVVLAHLNTLKETRLILWSSCHTDEKPQILEFFKSHGVTIHYFNENPEVKNTVTGDFSEKFYFSVLLDDKAGFDPSVDWNRIADYFSNVENFK